MTDPVVLYGTQSNGETLPVQVDDTGRLVAEGLPGPDGPQGPQGPQGPPGTGIDLPPDPYEGALLGWLNNELAWIGTPPVPIPPGVFGPIISWDPVNGVLEVEGEIPEAVGNGVYLYQCEADGTLFMTGSNPSQVWSSYGTGTPYSPTHDWNKAFNLVRGESGNEAFAGDSSTMTWAYDLPVQAMVRFVCLNSATPGVSGLKVNGNLEFEPTYAYDSVIDVSAQVLGGSLSEIQLINDGLTGPYLSGVQVDGRWLIDPEWSLQLRVNSVMGQLIIGNVINGTEEFQVGKYLKIPTQRVAPWVLYGNDPTSRIDYLRQTRD